MSDAPQTCCPNRPRRLGQHLGSWMEIGTLFLMAAFLLFSFFSGRLRFFLASYYTWLSLIAAVALLVMGVARLIAYFQGYISGELEESTGWSIPVSACMTVIFIPTVLVLAINPTKFTADGLHKRDQPKPPRDLAVKRAVDWALGVKPPKKKVPTGSYSLPRKPTIIDLILAADEAAPEDLEGQIVTVVGQCDFHEGPTDKRFDLFRLVVTCCIADATSVRIEVARNDQQKLEPGSWVRIRGQLKFDNEFDPAMPVIHAMGRVTPIIEPSEPYL